MDMSDQEKPPMDVGQGINISPALNVQSHPWRAIAVKAILLLLVIALSASTGYLAGSRIVQGVSRADTPSTQADPMELMQQINPPEGYSIPAVFGDVGSQLVAAGAIDMGKFTSLYQRQNRPLTHQQLDILSKDVTSQILFTPQNAYFLLNFFWALGLTNQNDILTKGPMMSGGANRLAGFASTAGWTLGARQAAQLYSSTRIITLTGEQQARLLEVALEVYRPCCDNPAHFPDCNHGMAMLGLLELMASQNATVDDMFTAAKYANAFWYPQQMPEIATALKITTVQDFAQSDARSVVSYSYSSISGFRSVHQWLIQNGLLQQAPSSAGSCGV
jgi:hypothetical protein